MDPASGSGVHTSLPCRLKFFVKSVSFRAFREIRVRIRSLPSSFFLFSVFSVCFQCVFSVFLCLFCAFSGEIGTWIGTYFPEDPTFLANFQNFSLILKIFVSPSLHKKAICAKMNSISFFECVSIFHGALRELWRKSCVPF